MLSNIYRLLFIDLMSKEELGRCKMERYEFTVARSFDRNSRRGMSRDRSILRDECVKKCTRLNVGYDNTSRISRREAKEAHSRRVASLMRRNKAEWYTCTLLNNATAVLPIHVAIRTWTLGVARFL